MTTPEPKPERRNDQQGDLPARLSAPAQRALAGAGITTLDDLTRYTEKEILNLHGMGPKTMSQLWEALADKGMSFADHA